MWLQSDLNLPYFEARCFLSALSYKPFQPYMWLMCEWVFFVYSVSLVSCGALVYTKMYVLHSLVREVCCVITPAMLLKSISSLYLYNEVIRN